MKEIVDLNKAVFTEKQRSEIDKKVNTFLEEQKRGYRFTMILATIVIIIIWGMVALINFEKSLMLIKYCIGVFICYAIIGYVCSKFEKDYIIVKAKVLNKKTATYKGNVCSLDVKLEFDNGRCRVYDSEPEVYNSIEIGETRIFVVCKKINGLLKGSIVADVTNMIE